MSSKFSIFSLLLTFYLAFQSQTIHATFLIESATAKALIQAACSACDTPPACYAVLNPISGNPNLNPNDICTVSVQAAARAVEAAHAMINMALNVANMAAQDPSMNQCLTGCAKEYATVLDLVDKAATALTQKVDEEKVPEYLSSAIGAVAKCDARVMKVATTMVQITNRNVDCTKLLKNALAIFNCFAESIAIPGQDPNANAGGNPGGVNINAGGSVDTSGSSKPKKKKDGSSSGQPSHSGGSSGASGGGKVSGDASGSAGGQISNDGGVHFSFSKQGEISSSGNVNGQAQTMSSSKDDSSHINAGMKFSFSDLLGFKKSPPTSDGGSPVAAPASGPSSDSSGGGEANAPSDDSGGDEDADGPSSDNSDTASGPSLYSGDNTEAYSPSASGDDDEEVSMKFSFSHLIPHM